MIGQTLTHYTILEKIGSGGMGDVYLAKDTKLDRNVALKVLPLDLAESEERRSRFKREAKALSTIQTSSRSSPSKKQREPTSSPCSSFAVRLSQSFYHCSRSGWGCPGGC